MDRQPLGAVLAQTIATEATSLNATRERAEALAAKQAREDYEAVAGFFERACEKFQADVIARKPSNELRIQVGRGDSTRGVDCHDDIYALIQGWNTSYNVPVSLSGKGKYSALWAIFQRWAASEGLRAFWDYGHDGVGVQSWLYLAVEPAHEVMPPQPPQETPGQEERRVLTDVLEAYMDASVALQALHGNERAQAHLAKFGTTLGEAKALYARLKLN